ncbi:Serine/threonine protein kinase [Phytophthora megakarya]|uniref:Serine/threonine protein kinase n=1 Tax=Phytophthora megakarya TaxID=4795 RepID=A0A225UIN1_9STRA|nr:Serine/threonine protein kinase [Phytophthora megakarya]
MCIVEALRVVENTDDKGSRICLPWRQLENNVVVFHVKSGKLPSKPTNCTSDLWELVNRMCAFEPQIRVQIALVVDELARLRNIYSKYFKYVVSGDSLTSKFGDVESVPDTIIAARNLLSLLHDNPEQNKSVLDLYKSLWDCLEKIYESIIDNSSTDKDCRTLLYSLVFDIDEATSKLQDSNINMNYLVETTLESYALQRRLDKFCEAYSLSSGLN